jgi:hypothetical protein
MGKFSISISSEWSGISILDANSCFVAEPENLQFEVLNQENSNSV